MEFLAFSPKSIEFLSRMPTEEELSNFFKYLREEKGMASSSMWTYYSQINGLIKGIYGGRLQQFPRITSLLKSYDVDEKKKASCFESDDIAAFSTHPSATSPYWLVRKAIIILSYFGGLRHVKLAELQLEKVAITDEGVLIHHSRAKQRSDKKSSKFLVPRSTDGGCNFASII